MILDLHFDACHFQRDIAPGLWRTGPIGVTAADGSLEFRGPDAADVPGLMAEVVAWLAAGHLEADAFVRAAMAHLHVTSVHPFRDGNGRVARIVQSLVLARWGRLESMVAQRIWPDRLAIALQQSLIGGVDRRRYSDEAGISAPTASADLRRPLDAGLVEQRGRGPSTSYAASDALRQAISS